MALVEPRYFGRQAEDRRPCARRDILMASITKPVVFWEH
jgi:hypothetical protein